VKINQERGLTILPPSIIFLSQATENDTMTQTLSPNARAALDAAIATKGKNKGMLKSNAPDSRTMGYAAWQGAMLSVNAFKASIAGMIFMSAEQKAIMEEIRDYFDSMPKAERIQFDRDRRTLEACGAW
jgi:hypothetical protein